MRLKRREHHPVPTYTPTPLPEGITFETRCVGQRWQIRIRVAPGTDLAGRYEVQDGLICRAKGEPWGESGHWTERHALVSAWGVVNNIIRAREARDVPWTPAAVPVLVVTEPAEDEA